MLEVADTETLTDPLLDPLFDAFQKLDTCLKLTDTCLLDAWQSQLSDWIATERDVHGLSILRQTLRNAETRRTRVEHAPIDKDGHGSFRVSTFRFPFAPDADLVVYWATHDPEARQNLVGPDGSMALYLEGLTPEDKIVPEGPCCLAFADPPSYTPGLADAYSGSWVPPEALAVVVE